MRGTRSVRNVVAGLLFFAPVGFAQQPGGPLDRELARRAIAEQEAAVTAKDAIAQAEKLARTHPDKAVRDLQTLRFSFATRTDLGSTKQTELLTQLGDAIARINRVGQKPAAGPDARVLVQSEKNRKALEAAQAEAKDVQAAVSEIAKDEADGRAADARAKAAALVKKYPTNAAAIQIGEFGLARENIAVAKASAVEYSRRFDKVMVDVRSSAMPAIADMEYPKDWDKLVARRVKINEVRLGEEEEALLRALETKITVPLKNQPFEEVIQSLSNSIGKNIYIDKSSFEGLGLEMRQLVSMDANVSARTALRGMLQSVGMTFIIRDKIIKVVSVEEARKNLMTRSYEVRDLVATGGPFNGGPLWGPYADAAQTQRNAEMLVDAIKASVDPASWTERNGPSTITFSYVTMSIIVRAPSEVHYSLGQAIYGKRK